MGTGRAVRYFKAVHRPVGRSARARSVKSTMVILLVLHQLTKSYSLLFYLVFMLSMEVIIYILERAKSLQFLFNHDLFFNMLAAGDTNAKGIKVCMMMFLIGDVEASQNSQNSLPHFSPRRMKYLVGS
jgi:hypothetical protein